MKITQSRHAPHVPSPTRHLLVSHTPVFYQGGLHQHLSRLGGLDAQSIDLLLGGEVLGRALLALGLQLLDSGSVAPSDLRKR